MVLKLLCQGLLLMNGFNMVFKISLIHSSFQYYFVIVNGLCENLPAVLPDYKSDTVDMELKKVLINPVLF